jgi:hypothetical protein
MNCSTRVISFGNMGRRQFDDFYTSERKEFIINGDFCECWPRNIGQPAICLLRSIEGPSARFRH